jgi:hypothetical protein
MRQALCAAGWLAGMVGVMGLSGAVLAQGVGSAGGAGGAGDGEPLQTAPGPKVREAMPALISTTAPGAMAPTAMGASGDEALPAMLQALSGDEQEYVQHVITLTSPFFEGRAPGLRGNELAVEYVEFFFRQYGLKPAFATSEKAADGTEVLTPNRSFRQRFPAGTDLEVTRAEAAVLDAAGSASALVAGKDFNVLAMSGSGTAEGEVVFVGYAIQEGPEGYSTFGPEDRLDGKLAMVLRFEPKDAAGKSKWSGEAGWSQAAGLAAKLRNVASRGAAGIILVNPPGADDPRATQLEDVRSMRRGGGALEIPVVMMTQGAADRLLQGGAQTLDALTRQADEAGGVKVVAGARGRIVAGVERRAVDAENVAAVLPGRGGLADEFVVIGAHLDHLGYGYFGSRDAQPGGKLHPGADDNASGTAGLVLAARRLAARYAAMKEGESARSVLFIGFNAEESGLNGARYFVRNSPIAASKTYAMLNMDMIGRVREGRLDVSGTGTAEGFADWLKPVFEASGLEVRGLPGGQGPSDHAAFYSADVPVLHFFSGLTREYHMPTDVYPTINYRGAVRVTGLVEEVAWGLARREGALVFTRSSGPSIDMTDPANRAASGHGGAGPAGQAAAGQPGQAAGPGMGGVRVRFGIAPGSYSDDKPGIEVGEVFANTTAAAIGLKAGDRMTAWNGKPVRDVEGWMQYLSAAKPGDEVEITWVREGQEMKGKGVLRSRDRGDR